MRALLSLFFGLLLCSSVKAEVTPPDTPAGHALAAWLEAVNSHDRATVVAYDAHFQQPEKPPERFLELNERTGGFTLVRVEKSEPLSVTALLQEKGAEGMWRFSLAITEAEAPKIAGAQLGPVETPPDLAPPRLKEADAFAALDGLIAKRVAEDAFSGVVLVGHHGKPAFERAVGLADREKKVKVGPDTQFRLGSMNKMFTTVAILQFIEAGKLGLDDPIGTVLTDYPNKDVATKVTIRHLLTHAGGTGDIFGPEFEAHRSELRTHDDYVKLYGERAPAFEPGSKRAYSNYGFILLGSIIEKLSGMSYYDYIDQRVYAPAGMTHSGSLPESTAVPARSVGYMRNDDQQWVRNDETLPWRGTAAGGGYSTAGDLLRFATALESGTLVSKDTLALATRGIGLGFFASGEGKLRSYGHAGGANGMNGDLRLYPELDTVVIALSNLDPPAAERLSDFYARRMPAK